MIKELPVIDTIVLDGIDRCGKDTLMGVIAMQDRKYILVCRGLQSCISYDKIYGRQITKYDFSKHSNELLVHIRVEKPDWEIRCKLTNEPKIDYDYHMDNFLETFELLKSKGLHTLELNSSRVSIYEMSRKILETADRLNSVITKGE